VAHSVSPAIHAAAYRTLGLSHSYELMDLTDEAALARAVEAVRSGELGGANVTVPWKRAALSLADRADASAADVGAANVLVRAPGEGVVAHNTDVMALVEELARLASSPARVLVLGAGGAALASVAAARALGAKHIAVSARKWTPGLDLAQHAQAADFVRLGAEPLAWSSDDGPLAAFAERSDVIVQATSAGMHGAGPGEDVARVIPWQKLSKHVVAYDLVYNPADTEFQRRARAAALVAEGGLGMLVAQAARAFELWLGVAPPREPMALAARRALAERSA
jgi:shikimate dehydrogenase